MSRTTVGYLLAILTVTLWSGVYIASNVVAHQMPPFQSTFWRWFIAAMVALPFCVKALIREKDAILLQMPRLIAMALTGSVFYCFFLYEAAETSQAISMSLINATTPVFILLLARLCFAQKLTLQHFIGIIFVFLGLIGIFTKGNLHDIAQITYAFGDIMMLMAAICFAIYSLLSEKNIDGVSTASMVSVSFSLASIFSFPFALWEMYTSPPVVYSADVIMATLFCGVCASALCYWLWILAIQRIGAIAAGFIYNTMPIPSAVLATLMLNEAVTWVDGISGVAIIGGVLIGTYKPKN